MIYLSSPEAGRSLAGSSSGYGLGLAFEPEIDDLSVARGCHNRPYVLLHRHHAYLGRDNESQAGRADETEQSVPL